MQRVSGEVFPVPDAGSGSEDQTPFCCCLYQEGVTDVEAHCTQNVAIDLLEVLIDTCKYLKYNGFYGAPGEIRTPDLLISRHRGFIVDTERAFPLQRR
jgi:hypothetical protein